MKTPTKDYFCNYYDQGLFIGSTPQGHNTISMCCFQEKKVTDTVSFDHPYLEKSRAQAQQTIPTECASECRHPGYHNERIRTRSESYWDNSGKKIKKLHLEQSLICNLTCISCSSRYSSAWAKDYHLFDTDMPVIQLKKYPEQVWQHLDFSEIEHVHFTGGEPLLNPDNLKILEHLDQIGRLGFITLTYNTNGTQRASARLVELWSKVRWVRLHFSLDGVGTTFEYTRYPASWTTVQENIQWYKQIQGPCILIEVNAIVGIHNVFNLPDFFSWWKQHCQSGNQGDNSQIFVKEIMESSHGGQVLKLKYMPKQFEQYTQDVLQSIIDLPGVPSLIPLLCQQVGNQWLEYFEKLDQLRGTNWRGSLQGPITTI
jgi:sulfatase maturation enzyme AslB (radical SAM superfamily)